MRNTALVFVLIFFSCLTLTSQESTARFTPEKNQPVSKQPIIDNQDSIIVDLGNSTLTATYIDVPIYIKSDDGISSYDYRIKFNLSKLTFSSTIDLTPSDPTVLSLSYFNPVSLYLSYTSSSFQGFPSNGVQITKIRFNLSSPCIPITAADFSDGEGILNGTLCSFRVTQLDFTRFIPNADFTTGPTCLNANIQYSTTSTIQSGSVTAWNWTFSNGDSSKIPTPITTYTNSGTAATTLIALSDAGCSDTVVKFINVNILPLSNFTYSFDCVKDSVLFSNTSTISSGSITTSIWNFGDLSGTSNLTNPAYHYNASGIYTVTLISVSEFSCSGTTTLSVDLTNKVSANFLSASFSTCVNATISFTDATTYPLSAISSWEWNFGDGSGTSTLQNPSYAYNSSGSFSVTLTSTSADGCKGFISKLVSVDAPPQLQFGVSSTTFCAVDSVNFTDLSVSPPGSNYSWLFGDGNTSSLQNPVHSYTTFGLYQVSLIVNTPGGCADTLSKLYTVSFPPPPPSLFTNTIISNAVVSFSNTTPNSVKVEWNFGDTQLSAFSNPVHTFPDVGTYKVCLTSYDAENCASSSCSDIYVGLSRVVAVPSCFTPNQDFSNDVLKVKGGPLVEMKFQIFNEWGNLIFSSNTQELGWDGNFNGEPQPVGVYKYILNGRTPDNKVINIYGIVNLIR